MARACRDPAPAPRQLTLDDWAQVLKATREPASAPAAAPEPVAALVDALAPRLAEELSSRILATATPDAAGTARLLTPMSWSPNCLRRNGRRRGSAGSTSGPVAVKFRAA
jgi:hypothetical protein